VRRDTPSQVTRERSIEALKIKLLIRRGARLRASRIASIEGADFLCGLVEVPAIAIPSEVPGESIAPSKTAQYQRGFWHYSHE